MKFQRYKYSKDLDASFASDVKFRVNEYFIKNNLSKAANPFMIFKSTVMCLLFFGPLFIMYTGWIENLLLLYILWIIMGVGKAGIGTGIMHDAIHGSFSKSKKINQILSYSMNIIGGNTYVWYMQHNILHHTYPNVEDADDDLDIPFLLRMSPGQPRHWFHRGQHIYVWLLYSFATIFWVTTKDFVQLNKYKKRGLLKSNSEYYQHLWNIIIWKVVYYGYLLVLPIVLIPVSTIHIILMFLVMHLVAGILLSIIFQPAHVFTGTCFIQQEEQNINKSWIAYQLETTTNFKLSGFLKWMAGGLNYQIEHHLFPKICHVHYPEISPIVEKTAKEHNLPYHQQSGMFQALALHADMLKSLGKPML